MAEEVIKTTSCCNDAMMGGLLGAPRCHQPVYHGFRRQGRHLQDHVFRPSSAAPSTRAMTQGEQQAFFIGGIFNEIFIATWE